MPKYVTINGNLVTQTEKAWLVEVDGDEDKKHWIAKSQIHEMSEENPKPGDEDVDIVVNDWYYSQKLEGKL